MGSAVEAHVSASAERAAPVTGRSAGRDVTPARNAESLPDGRACLNERGLVVREVSTSTRRPCMAISALSLISSNATLHLRMGERRDFNRSPLSTLRYHTGRPAGRSTSRLQEADVRTALAQTTSKVAPAGLFFDRIGVPRVQVGASGTNAGTASAAPRATSPSRLPLPLGKGVRSTSLHRRSTGGPRRRQRPLLRSRGASCHGAQFGTSVAAARSECPHLPPSGQLTCR
jgi:hypothetical protein